MAGQPVRGYYVKNQPSKTEVKLSSHAAACQIMITIPWRFFRMGIQ
jgi:hypothetical protein